MHRVEYACDPTRIVAAWRVKMEGDAGSLDWKLPYPSRRMPVFGDDVVATSQPLAAQAGLAMLERGGNAIDAALATAITLTVVEPTNNGLGSDAFAIVWDGQALSALNASGRVPAALRPEVLACHTTMPAFGWPSVTVPGAVSAWVELSRRFGALPFADLFVPAIRYARDGFAISPRVAIQWAATANLYGEYPEFGATFLPAGRPPRPGERFRLPELGRSLEAVATSAGEAFYRGELARAMAAHARATGGFLAESDLAAHRADWVETLSTHFAGVDLHEIPPNGQGIAALMALGMLRETAVQSLPIDSLESVHLQIEAMKLAFADAHRYVGDPACMEVAPEAMLDAAYLAQRARSIDANRASEVSPGHPGGGDTVYLAAADRHGRMVSFIQSNYFGFGSGIVVPGTGISLQNRGSGFCLESGHPNQLAPGKRPFHTILPGFVMSGSEPRMAFGVMGGSMQPQGHLQMLLRIFGHGQNPQAASDAPRWQVWGDGSVGVEPEFDAAVVRGLRELGHTVHIQPSLLFGGAQLIYRLDAAASVDGGRGYVAGSDHRKDGHAVAV